MNRIALIGLILHFLMISCEGNKPIPVLADLSHNETEIIEVNCPELKFSAPTISGLPQKIMKFVPADYLVLDTVQGLLNDDQFKDLILVLKYKCEGDSELNGSFPEARPMLILIRDKVEGYSLVKRNDNIVFCYNCGGVMGDPYQGMVIKNRGFVIQHYGGSASRWQQTVSFKYSKPDNDWYLVEKVNEGFHSAEPDRIKKKVFTQKDFGSVNFESYHMED